MDIVQIQMAALHVNAIRDTPVMGSPVSVRIVFVCLYKMPILMIAFLFHQ